MQTANFNSNRKTWILSLALLLSIAAQAQQPKSVREIVVSIPDRKLALVENGEVVKVYPVAVGKTSSPSPAGRFKIVNRLQKPTYYHKGVVVGPGSANPLGTRWMGLDQKGYGIHGTNVPKSIGKAASHGCIRMSKKDLEELFAMVQVGDQVEIRADRDDATAKLFGGDAPAEVVATNTTPAPVAAAASTTGQ
jgi:L,D-transpeptidase ErfK/SrfK